MPCRTKPRPVVAFALAAALLLLPSTSASSAQKTQAARDLLTDPTRVDTVIVKVLTSNDDSGRHGVRIPVAAWNLFPQPADQSDGSAPTSIITTLWQSAGRSREEPTNYKHYDRYPERRLTGLNSPRLNLKPAGSLLLLARHRATPAIWEARVIYPADDSWAGILRSCGLSDTHPQPGQFAILRNPADLKAPQTSHALRAFLTEFDAIATRGWIRTRRPGSTGIGYTLESLLDLRENNSPRGDFLGMELKAYRDHTGTLDDSEKMNLFLKEPRWLAEQTSADRIAHYGYTDENGRRAWYSTVTSKTNTHGLRLATNRGARQVTLLHAGQPIAVWKSATLAERLDEKHSEAAFIAADCRGSGPLEEFRYHSVTWCTGPSVESLLDLIDRRHVMVELRMHIRPDGTARNHGTAFRIHKSHLQELFARTVQVRRHLP